MLLQDIVQLASDRPIMAALSFSEEALGPDTERYTWLLGLETNSQAAFPAPELGTWITFRANLAAALACIDEADATLGADLRSLVLQIVGVLPDSNTPGRGYGGASSFMLCVAVPLNVEQHGTVLDMIAGLVHEAANQLLFGLSVDEPLVENAMHERFVSPLRTDLRLMDGYFPCHFCLCPPHYGYFAIKAVREREVQ